jgi:hypothetical protein
VATPTAKKTARRTLAQVVAVRRWNVCGFKASGCIRSLSSMVKRIIEALAGFLNRLPAYGLL